jgi:hypothetical protein
MMHLRNFGLVAMSVLALTAIAGQGSAAAEPSVLCVTTATPCNLRYSAGTALDISLVPGTSLSLVETDGDLIQTCTGATKKGKITVEGSSTQTVTGKWETVTLSGCTFPATATRKGKFRIDPNTGTDNGTITADTGAEEDEEAITINTVFFGSCVYGLTPGTSLGTLTGGNPAKVDFKAAAKKVTGSNFVCPETAIWTGSYLITEPNATLHVEPGS